MNPRMVGLWLTLLLLVTAVAVGKTRKQHNCPQCHRDSLVDVVFTADETALKDVEALAEGAGGTIEALEDGQGYLAQLPAETIKRLSRRGLRVAPRRQPVDGVMAKDGDWCQEAIAAELGVACGGETTPETPMKWYSFTPTTTGTYLISLAGSDFDTILSVFDACDGNLVAYNDDSGLEFTSEVTLEMEAGTTYYILIEGYWGETGNYVLLIEEHVTVPGEACLNPIVVEPGTPYEGSLTFTALEIWHAFTPPESGDYVIDLAGSTFDTILYVFPFCGGYASAYNDDASDLQSRLSMYMHAETTYLIMVTTWDDIGPYNFLITPVTEKAPHDTVSGAIPVSIASPTHGCTDAATSSLSYSSCGGSDTRDVWHSYIAASTGFVRLNLQGHDFDVTVSVFDEARGAELACNDQMNDCTNDAGLSMEMVQGKRYLIRVAGYDSGTGHYTLTLDPVVSSVPTAPQTPTPADGTEEVPTDVVLSWDNWVVPPVTQQASQMQTNRKASGDRTPKIIYGRDDRIDEYQVKDASIRDVGDATVVLMPKSIIELATRRQKYVLQDTTTLAEYIALYYGIEMCPDEPFRNQPAPGMCSGFLVAPDLIVTAGHCVGCEGDIEDMVAVFNFKMTDANTPVTLFDVNDVYFCREQVVGQYGVPDWSLVRLDRPVTGHVPLRIRRSGTVAEQQRLLVAGHPVGLPRKYDMGGTVKDNWQRSYFTANVDTFGGNSGSAVFNLDTLTVEGILVWGMGDFAYDDAGCVRSDVCAESGCPGFEYATCVSLLSSAVPSYDVFMGRDPDHLVQVDSGWAAAQFEPEGLEPGQTYYWRVLSRNAAGQTLGPVWSFTTAP